MANSKVTAVQKAEMVERRSAGESCRQIASDYGVSYETVRRHTSVSAPVPIAKQRESVGGLTTAIGTTGLERAGNFIDEEFLPQLQGQRAAQVYKEMTFNDPIVAGTLRTIEMQARSVAWWTEPGGDSDADEAAADFVDSVRNDMELTWEDTISEILSKLAHGFSYHETIYKRRLGMTTRGNRISSRFNDGRWGLRGLPIRAQETIQEWVFDDDGNVTGAIQQAAPNYHRVFIPMQKALLFRTTAHKNNPEGHSLLRSAYRPWYYKKQFENMEAVGLERHAAGVPIARMPSSEMTSGNAAYTAMKQLVRRFKRDEQAGVVIPSDRDDNGNHIVELEFAKVEGTMPDFDKAIARKNMEIATTMLSDFILLGHEKVGSFALADSKTHSFALALNAWLDAIADVFNRTMIPRLLALNGISVENPPQYRHADIETPDTTMVGALLQAMTLAGFPQDGNEELERWLLRIMGAPAGAIEKLQKATGAQMALDNLYD